MSRIDRRMDDAFWTSGYKASELRRAEIEIGFEFPPDLYATLLKRAPAKGHDWRNLDAIRRAMGEPLHGLLFDVEFNGMWLSAWGEKPQSIVGQKAVIQKLVAEAPLLLPLYGHRYLPASPSEEGNPVFSVVQSDVIYYGASLSDYFERELHGWSCCPWPDQLKYVAFWSELAMS